MSRASEEEHAETKEESSGLVSISDKDGQWLFHLPPEIMQQWICEFTDPAQVELTKHLSPGFQAEKPMDKRWKRMRDSAVESAARSARSAQAIRASATVARARADEAAALADRLEARAFRAERNARARAEYAARKV